MRSSSRFHDYFKNGRMGHRHFREKSRNGPARSFRGTSDNAVVVVDNEEWKKKEGSHRRRDGVSKFFFLLSYFRDKCISLDREILHIRVCIYIHRNT